MKRLMLICGLLLVVLSVPILSEATPVAINNPGFEDPALSDGSWQVGIPGWTTLGSAGVWNPLDEYISIPEGSNVSWINSASIYQQLAYTLTPNTQLTLSVDIGWRSDAGLGVNPGIPGYEVQLWAVDTGGTETLLASNSTTPLVEGDFATSTVSYFVTDSNPFLDQALKIVLLKTEGVQVNFDNVRLENEAVVPVPEPSTLLLIGSGLVVGYFIRRMRG